MPEKLKEILEKIKEWWNKFTTKQKTPVHKAGHLCDLGRGGGGSRYSG